MTRVVQDNGVVLRKGVWALSDAKHMGFEAASTGSV